jgi:hypothetical protein
MVSSVGLKGVGGRATRTGAGARCERLALVVEPLGSAGEVPKLAGYEECRIARWMPARRCARLVQLSGEKWGNKGPAGGA